MSNKTALKAEFTRKALEGRIRGLAKQLYTLAPHPENPEHRGPLFISLPSAFKPAAEYDGMLGSIMLESFLGTAFAAVANDNSETAGQIMGLMGQNQLDMVGDVLDEYLEYSEEKKRHKGQGSFALGEHKTLCNQFNAAPEAAAWDSFFADLGVRMRIEETIVSLIRQAGWNARAEKAAIPGLCAA